MYVVIAHLYVRPDRWAEFEAYEREALAIFASYGGEVIARFRPAEGPGEIHALRIDSEQAFQGFRNDSRLAALKAMRDAAIERTDLFAGENR